MSEASDLTAGQKATAAIGALTAKGDMPKLEAALDAGLDAGLSVNEIKEILAQMYAYAGFPRSLNGLDAFMRVLAERKSRGINDVVGAESSPLPAGKSKMELGSEIQTALAGGPVKGPLFEFSPEIDVFLKEHLFCDIFGRDGLDFKSREIATIAALSCSDGLEAQLTAHLRIGMNAGLTERELRSLIESLGRDVGPEAARRVNCRLDAVLGSGGTAGERAASSAEMDASSTFPRGVKLSNEHFTGDAWLFMLVDDDNEFNCPVACVDFAPGARNNWHKHPGGQMLVALGGTGFFQRRGQPARVLRKGDVVKIPPDVEHWHGATPDSEFSHLAIGTNPRAGAPAEWLQPVSDEEYKNCERK